MVVNKTHQFKSTDQTRSLFYQTFEKSKSPKAQLVITHGLGEHSDCYSELAHYLCSNLPINIITWDFVGHGRSDGQRGYVGDIDWLIQDLQELLIKETYPSLPIFTLSHSLGGLINIYSEQIGNFKSLDMKGCIFSNPGIQLNFTPPKWKLKAAHVLAQTIPQLTLGNEISKEQLSSHRPYLKNYPKDNLRHEKISARLFLGMTEMQFKIQRRQSKTPALSILSTNDPICNSRAADFILSNSSKVVFFKDSLHEVLQDIEKENAYSKIKEFINENI